MLEEFFKLLALLRTFVYLSICLSSLLVASSYLKAYREVKPTWIIQSIMILFFSIAFSFLFFSLASIINFLDGASFRYKVVVSLLALANLPLLWAIINFWFACLFEKKENK
jgi:hypothetical protein